MIYRKKLCDCYNTGELAFSKGDKREIGLGNVSFVVAQEFEQEVPLLRECSGIFFPNDNVYKLSQDLIEGTSVMDTIQGTFKDRITGEEAAYTLVNVLFTTMSFGPSPGWPFFANSVQKTSGGR